MRDRASFEMAHRAMVDEIGYQLTQAAPDSKTVQALGSVLKVGVLAPGSQTAKAVSEELATYQIPFSITEFNFEFDAMEVLD